MSLKVFNITLSGKIHFPTQPSMRQLSLGFGARVTGVNAEHIKTTSPNGRAIIKSIQPNGRHVNITFNGRGMLGKHFVSRYEFKVYWEPEFIDALATPPTPQHKTIKVVLTPEKPEYNIPIAENEEVLDFDIKGIKGLPKEHCYLWQEHPKKLVCSADFNGCSQSHATVSIIVKTITL